jgi:outer membrane receptor for ferrienterochelin and colicins
MNGTGSREHRAGAIAGALVWAALCGISLAGAADAPCRIEGQVQDPGGGVLEGATVIVEPQGHVTETDAAGRYCVEQAQPGVVRVRVDAGARGSALSAPLRLGTGGTLHADLVLEPSVHEEVVVTGTRTPRKLAETPVRVEVIEREAIESSKARTLAEAVELTPGVRVENNCQNCNFAQVRLLGLQGAYSQILVDGQPTMSALAAVYGIEHIPAEFIERLEVVKGGGSALYGPGSVAGVVNVIPKDPARRGGSIGYRHTWTDGEPGSSLTAGYEWLSESQRTGFTAFAQRDDMGAVDTSGDGYTELGWRELEAFGVRLLHTTRGRNAQFTLDVSDVHEDRRGGNHLHLPVQEADVAEAVETRRRSVSLRWDLRRGNGFDAHVTLARAETNRDTYYGSGRDPNAFGETENPLTVVDVQLNHRRDRHVLTWGAQLSRDELEDSQPAYDRFYDETYQNIGAYVQSDWRISEQVELVTGARADDFSALDEPLVSPRLAVKYAPRKGWNYRLSVATGFRGPQVFDEDLHITQVGGEGAVIRNSPELVEESSLSTMLGVEWLPLWKGGQGRFEVSAFHTALDDIFLVEETDDPATPGQLEFTRINGGGAAVYGVEVGGSLALGSRLTFDGGLIAQRGRLEEPDPDFGSRDIPRTPELYANAALIYRAVRGVDLRVAARYTSSMTVPHYAGYIPEDRLETAPSFTTFDLGMAWLVPLRTQDLQLELSAGVRNVTDEYQEDLDEGPDRDAGYLYGPRRPREFYAGIGFDF